MIRSLRPAWATSGVPDQAGLHSKKLSEKIKKAKANKTKKD
jgi:hypothetical protein